MNRGNVAELADCARARWKIENETFNVLKQHGYHLEHNFGHGKGHPGQRAGRPQPVVVDSTASFDVLSAHGVT